MVARPRNGRPYRRAQALLWLAEGESASAVAPRLRVQRATIDAWAMRYRQRGVQRVPTRIWIEPDERWGQLKPGLSVTVAIEHGPGDSAWAAAALLKEAEIAGIKH